MNFEKYAASGNFFLHEISAELANNGDTGQAYRVARAVFRTLRIMLLPGESAHIIAQLPVMLKAVYVDGWNLQQAAVLPANVHEFVEYIIAQDGKSAGVDFAYNDLIPHYIRAVFKVMFNYISAGEMIHIINQLPGDIAVFVQPLMPED